MIKFLYRSVKSFPKEYKYTIGTDTLNCAWECLDLIVEANVLPNKEKHAKLLKLSIALDKLKMRVRMIQEIQLISKRQFVHIYTNYIKEIGDMTGGWTNWSRQQQSIL